MDRRNFLFKTGSILGVSIFASSIATVITACEHDPNLTSSGATTGSIKLTDYPQLMKIGGAAQIYFQGRNQEYPVIIVRRTTDYIVLSTMCQHQGFQVGMPNSNMVITCPGHGAQYSANDGSVLKLPNTGQKINGLPTFQYKIDQQTNIMTITFP